MSRLSPAVRAHRDWLALIRPTGLVVAPSALVSAGAFLPRRDREGPERLREWLDRFGGRKSEPPPAEAFRSFAGEVLDWSFDPAGYAGRGDEQTPVLRLPEYGETLRADFAVRERDFDADGEAADASRWQLAAAAYGPDQDLDKPFRGGGRLDESPGGRMERLLRATGIPAGVVWGGGRLRLVSAPRGESSGYLDFVLGQMAETAGRPLLAALRLLLSESRLLSLPTSERLPALLTESRQYQNEVSIRLAGQVLEGLYELLRGVGMADAQTGGALLGEAFRESGTAIYRALLAVMLRLVFILYAEQRGLLPQDETFVRHYSLGALFERLRADAGRHPDTMDQRFGAWAQLLTLFRMVHDGARADGMKLPPRHGALFDPDRHPFLEGRMDVGGRQTHERIDPPRIPDGTVLEVLRKLLVLDGERISYRALDVEQIGSVYETMMGFRLERAAGPSLAVRSPKKHGAASVVNLEAMLDQPPRSRRRWVQRVTDRRLSPKVAKAVAAARTVGELHRALDPVVDRAATPDIAPAGALVLQPTEERRRSGSHYTPRTLTEPIVRRTLEPILARLREDGRPPRPEAVLDLRVCDPAMGSGAFLVEADRQLAEALIEGWRAHGGRPPVPPDEDETIFARRIVARRCLYGVDRNPVAVDLAKLSLWLATLAKDQPLTFLDHALRAGDSLVGLSRDQIERVHWNAGAPPDLFAEKEVAKALHQVGELRREIREAGEEAPDVALRALWRDAESALAAMRLFGDLVVGAFFGAAKPRAREALRKKIAADINRGEAESRRPEVEARREADPPLAPFHWEIEFPEVFSERKNPGFDAFVGNPPFLGGKRKSTVLGRTYKDWLLASHEQANGNMDLAAHFFRQCFGLVRLRGTLGLIATNTIAQGDTRSGGLRWICENGGQIYNATRRYPWPGQAAVVVSVVHLANGEADVPKLLDGRSVQRITAFLFHRGSHSDPLVLPGNANRVFNGMFLRGMGFTFDDTDKKGVASPVAEMQRLVAQDPKNREVIAPFIGGAELNGSPTHAHHRYAINFWDYPLRRSRMGLKWWEATDTQRRSWLRTGVVPHDYPEPVAADWPELLAIVRHRVKPERDRVRRVAQRQRWWRYAETRPGLREAMSGLDRVLAISLTGQHGAFAFLPDEMVYSHALNVFPLSSFAAFAALQSRPHEIWARFFGSTLGDGLRYTPSDCFETFPFPDRWDTRPAFEAVGKACYEHRARLMVANDEGLTKTYNRFHDPDERSPAILKLRELHAAMDAAVLHAYGWTDIETTCDFFPDHEDDPRSRLRCRWPDPIQHEILARLLDLNHHRAAAERGGR